MVVKVCRRHDSAASRAVTPPAFFFFIPPHPSLRSALIANTASSEATSALLKRWCGTLPSAPVPPPLFSGFQPVADGKMPISAVRHFSIHSGRCATFQRLAARSGRKSAEFFLYAPGASAPHAARRIRQPYTTRFFGAPPHISAVRSAKNVPALVLHITKLCQLAPSASPQPPKGFFKGTQGSCQRNKLRCHAPCSSLFVPPPTRPLPPKGRPIMTPGFARL